MNEPILKNTQPRYCNYKLYAEVGQVYYCAVLFPSYETVCYLRLLHMVLAHHGFSSSSVLSFFSPTLPAPRSQTFSSTFPFYCPITCSSLY